MVGYNRDIKTKIDSALFSALNLFMNFYKQLKYWLGLLLIDKFLRKIVNWYDKRHIVHSNDKTGYQDNFENQLLEQSESLNSTISHLRRNILILESNRNELSRINESLISEVNQLTKEREELNIKIQVLLSKIDDLDNVVSRLHSRCLPESNIPSMIYYAEGDTAGIIFRKISTKKTPQHIYKIMTVPGDTQMATFEPDVTSDCKEIINNRNIMLLACEILSIAPNASNIEVRKRGEAILVNNKWNISNKAQIVLS